MDSRLADIASQLATLSEQLNAIVSASDIGKAFDPSLHPALRSAFDNALDHLMEREGFRLTVYADTLGIPTVGVGHVVRPEDNLKLGDTITKERAHAFLQQDAKHAFDAATSQLNELGLNDSDFLVALTSVAFQLGTKWTKKFPKTWALIKEKRYNEAAIEVADSLWARQTPVRVRDFQKALRDLET